MEHFYHNIQGWFDFQDVYTGMVNHASDNAHFVEVGSWKGRSSAYMAVEIVNSGKPILFDCVDIWQADNNDAIYQTDAHVKNNTLYQHFIDNMKPVDGYYRAFQKGSVEAAELYQDKSLDFVFIDASHTYENVYADIKAYLPKIRSGGVIGGHDYTTSDGVRRAVAELVPNYTQISSSSWICVID